MERMRTCLTFRQKGIGNDVRDEKFLAGRVVLRWDATADTSFELAVDAVLVLEAMHGHIELQDAHRAQNQVVVAQRSE